ncbi:winged helix-turn-helix domain-containing protein [Fusibacter sp. 3D3]|uniref:winged helix-turn-helix domain-containing protein n=1 Tax=Fusibacter sp. 3D3 TaxID=1048380 RepID=UPI000852A90D|nr:crosslink repair DNA glycosylase YcaQ family protein [Fusibacter sp. 3D3]GAU79067.1 putative cytoplasmic protein clustered with trehalase [Fusibacter sp. 3D3]
MKSKYILTIPQARYFLLKKHGLIDAFKFKDKEGVLAFIKQVGCIQFDPIDVCGKNPELVLQSRIEHFNKEMLSELLYEDRGLVDYFDKNLSIFPIEDWPYFASKRTHYQNYHRSQKEVDQVTNDVLQYIHENTFACSKDIHLREKVNWAWSDTSLGRATLETLYFRGDLVVHHKKGTLKYYALTKDFIDSEILNCPNPNESQQAQIEWHILRRIGAVGMLWNKASDAWLGIDQMKTAQRKSAFETLIRTNKVIELEVEGLEMPFYILEQDQLLLETCLEVFKNSTVTESLLPRVSFLAPLDNLLWDRKLIKALFNFEYKWEIYTPFVERQFGYYVLPILYKDTLVGRIEMVNNKKDKTLEVKKIWYEETFKPDPEFKKHLKLSLKRFADFNKCIKVKMLK